MTKQEEIRKGLSNELNFTRLAGHIIGDNLDKSPIEIGNLIVREFHSQGVVIRVGNPSTFNKNYCKTEPLIGDE